MHEKDGCISQDTSGPVYEEVMEGLSARLPYDKFNNVLSTLIISVFPTVLSFCKKADASRLPVLVAVRTFNAVV